jgi:hypothetical protein
MDAVPLFICNCEQLVFDVRDPDVAWAQALNRIWAHQMLQQQGETQANRSTLGYRDT